MTRDSHNVHFIKYNFSRYMIISAVIYVTTFKIELGWYVNIFSRQVSTTYFTQQEG